MRRTNCSMVIHVLRGHERQKKFFPRNGTEGESFKLRRIVGIARSWTRLFLISFFFNGGRYLATFFSVIMCVHMEGGDTAGVKMGRKRDRRVIL